MMISNAILRSDRLKLLIHAQVKFAFSFSKDDMTENSFSAHGPLKIMDHSLSGETGAGEKDTGN